MSERERSLGTKILDASMGMLFSPKSEQKKGMPEVPVKKAEVDAPQTIVPGGASVIDTIKYKNEQTRKATEDL